MNMHSRSGKNDPRLLSQYLLDLLLLADVFQTFRNTYLKNYKLDPAHIYTAPGLAWQALLKTAAEYYDHEKKRKDCELCPDEFSLELLTDIDMLLMVEKCIRDGITQAVKRYAKAENKHMKDLHNPNEKSTYVVHIKGLDQALKHGLKLKKVHRVIEFQQSRWMKTYIMLNTRLRKDAKN